MAPNEKPARFSPERLRHFITRIYQVQGQPKQTPPALPTHWFLRTCGGIRPWGDAHSGMQTHGIRRHQSGGDK